MKMGDTGRMLRLVEQVVEDVRSGRITAQRANAVAALVRSWTSLSTFAQAEAELTNRLERLEEALRAQPRRTA